jgi:hypothetical protein
MTALKVTALETTGEQFSHPYIDVDEERREPRPHRFVHGGFENTTTRFALYFPPADDYDGRFFHQPGANYDGPGMENILIELPIFGGLDFAFDAQAFLISSVIFGGYDSEPGDATYQSRACKAVALQARQIAAQIYGEEPHHGYLWGGSGGGRRTLNCMEKTKGVWDGAVPFMTGGYVNYGNVSIFSNFYSVQSNVRRLLGPKIEMLIDALEPGGSGNPFEGLTSEQAREVATMFRLGFPRGSEFLLRDPTAEVALWTWQVRDVLAHDSSYFERFWSEPGYVGFDNPGLLAQHVLDEKVTVKRVLTATELSEIAEGSTPGAAAIIGGLPVLLRMMGDTGVPVGVELDTELAVDPSGARIRISSGAAAGRTLYALAGAGRVIVASTTGAEEALAAFGDVQPGDELTIDNREFIAYGYYYRHHTMYDELMVDGIPMHPQDAAYEWPTSWGDLDFAGIHGKVTLIHHAQDPYVWPPDMLHYVDQVDEYLGDRRAESFRFYFTDRAEHIYPPMKDEGLPPVHSTHVINYTPVIEQAMHDVVAWVEKGIAPADDTVFDFTRDKAVVLAPTAAERKGIQPVVTATANGGARAEVSVGEPVTLEAHAVTPPGGGTIVSIEWDAHGLGDWPIRDETIDGTKSEVRSATTVTFDKPGTYFASARASSHRQGDVNATRRRVPNIARVRVVVS